MAYDTTWSDDKTLDDARDALMRSKGFSKAEATQAIIGLVESGFLIRTTTSRRQDEPYPDKDHVNPPDHLRPHSPQNLQILTWGPEPYGLGEIISVEPVKD